MTDISINLAQIRTGNTVHNISSSLVKDVNNDYVVTYLEEQLTEYTNRRLAYWWECVRMKRLHNVISVPLLVLSSATGVTSAAQVAGKYGQWLNILVTTLGVLCAIFSAMQRYFSFSERAEHNKYMAKNYARIVRKIKHHMIFVKSGAASMDNKTFREFIDDIQKEIETVTQQANDIPRSILLKVSPDEEDEVTV